ncbi:MAG: hypothetical protein KDD70_17580 [Bdellovibrionales bacterium]|nr:hypothetical protein [Bdellovibrionales bacterium]
MTKSSQHRCFQNSLRLCLLALSAGFQLLPSTLSAEDLTLLGGDTTSFLPAEAALQVVAPNVTDQEKRMEQLDGFSVFHRINRPQTGIGPQLVNVGCGRCHLGNGKGRVKAGPLIGNSGNTPSSMVIKASLQGLQENGAPIDPPNVTEQLKVKFNGSVRKREAFIREIYGSREARWPRLRFRKVSGQYPDGTKYTLLKPILRVRLRGVRRSQLVTSIRMTPALVGMGLIEAIPEEKILEWSDPEDSDSDGISGRPNYIPDLSTNSFAIGRFGHRAGQPNVHQQSAAAAFHDMGVTSSLFNTGEPGEEPELSDFELRILTVYQQLAGVPAARDQSKNAVIAGQEIFKQLNCDSCHKMTVTTSHAEHPELNDQIIHPFTDLLLHDMGPQLADERAEFSASGSEFRTAPLMGIGHLKKVSQLKRLHFLHDGRARNIEEAILWHGGEAEAAKEAFKALALGERTALIRFIESL